MRFQKLSLGVLVLSLVTGLSTGAGAVTDEERAAARAAAGQGADAFDAGRWADAVELFSRAEALVHSPAHLLFIGRAQLKLGQWVKAYENFNRIKREPVTADSPPATKRAIDEATAELAKLEPQLPYVAAKVKNPSGEVQVMMDGVKVPPLLIGLLRPVDPGQHQFQATNGYLSSDVLTLDVKPGTKQTIELELKGPATAEPVAAPPPVPAAATTASPTQDSAPAAQGGGSNPLRIASYGAMGLGAAGLVVGTIFLVKSGSTQQEADDLCPTNPCDASKQDEIDSLDEDAASEQTLGAVGLGVGAALAATGVVLFVVSGKKEASAAERRPGITPYVGWQSAGITGRF